MKVGHEIKHVGNTARSVTKYASLTWANWDRRHCGSRVVAYRRVKAGDGHFEHRVPLSSLHS